MKKWAMGIVLFGLGLSPLGAARAAAGVDICEFQLSHLDPGSVRLIAYCSRVLKKKEGTRFSVDHADICVYERIGDVPYSGIVEASGGLYFRPDDSSPASAYVYGRPEACEDGFRFSYSRTEPTPPFGKRLHTGSARFDERRQQLWMTEGHRPDWPISFLPGSVNYDLLLSCEPRTGHN